LLLAPYAPVVAAICLRQVQASIKSQTAGSWTIVIVVDIIVRVVIDGIVRVINGIVRVVGGIVILYGVIVSIVRVIDRSVIIRGIIVVIVTRCAGERKRKKNHPRENPKAAFHRAPLGKKLLHGQALYTCQKAVHQFLPTL